MKKIIYIVEDEESIRDLLDCTFANNDYETVLFSNSADMFAEVKSRVPNLILLDVMLPDIDGFETLKRLKKDFETEDVPVILITAKSSEPDKVKGLDLGADDYITKPFGVLELLARVRLSLRRFGQKDCKNEKNNLIKTKDILINLDTVEVFNNDQLVELTLKEFKLLKMLVENTKKVVKRDDILSNIWGYNFIGETRTLDMHIKTLRTKLGDNVDSPKYIKTVRGMGYKFIQDLL